MLSRNKAKSPKRKPAPKKAKVTEKTENIAEAPEPVKPTKNIYYSPQSRQTFSVIAKDSNGKPVTEKNRRGEERWLNGEPLLITRTIRFTTISSNPSHGTLSIYETSNPDEIKRLDELSDQPHSSVMTELQYQRSKNKEAFEAKLKAASLEQENVNLKASKEAAESKIETLQRQVASLSGGNAEKKDENKSMFSLEE